jgi:hypothetical protein
MARFNNNKAWKLVGRCVAALFSLLEPYCSPVMMLEDMSTLDNKVACLWVILQWHRVRKSFDLVKYRQGTPRCGERNESLCVDGMH